MIPLIGEMSAKQTKGCPNSENFAPAAYAPSDEGAVKCTAFDWGRDFSLSLPSSRLAACHPLTAAVTFVARRGRKRRAIRESPLQP